MAGVSCFLAGDIPALLWKVTAILLPEVVTTLILDGEDVAFVFGLATDLALLLRDNNDSRFHNNSSKS